MLRFAFNTVRRKENVGEAKRVVSKVMTVRELSEYFGVHRATIYKLLRKGELPAFRIGTDWRFNAEDVDRLCVGRNINLGGR
jgi:excisionase family DNA binding protein